MRVDVGLRTFRYVFLLTETAKYRRYMKRLANCGEVRELFLNNQLGFELRLRREA